MNYTNTNITSENLVFTYDLIFTGKKLSFGDERKIDDEFLHVHLEDRDPKYKPPHLPRTSTVTQSCVSLFRPLFRLKLT